MRYSALLVLFSLIGCQSAKETLVGRAIDDRRADAGLEVREVDVSGQTVVYLERTGTEPSLVLVHGFGAQKDAWLDFAAALPPDRRLLIVDLAGHGDSPAEPGARYDAPRYAADVARWLSETASGPVDLAGNSMGGLVAALVAIETPQAIRRLVLFDPAGVPSPVRSGLDSLIATGTNPLIPTTRAEYDRLLSFAFATPPNIPGIARDVLVADAQRRAPFLRDLFAALNDTPGNLLARLPEIEQPTLVIWGAQDRVLDPSAAPLWIGALPDGTLAIFPGVGHAPMMEAPDQTARLTSDFLR